MDINRDRKEELAGFVSYEVGVLCEESRVDMTYELAEGGRSAEGMCMLLIFEIGSEDRVIDDDVETTRKNHDWIGGI